MREEGLTPAFEALPNTILNGEDYYDHHLLFHLFLAPRRRRSGHRRRRGADARGQDRHGHPARAGGRGRVVFAARAGRALRGRLGAGAFAVSEAFLYRMSMARAQSGAVIILALALHWLLNGRHKWLAPLGFLFVWFYNAFPLLLVVAGSTSWPCSCWSGAWPGRPSPFRRSASPWGC